MRRALDEYEIAGIRTTLPFFREVLRDEVFAAGNLDTGYITEFEKRRALGAPKLTEQKAAVLVAALSYSNTQKAVPTNTKAPESNWARAARRAGLRS
jgi:acetyl/propionyl-CoA carboxylase alpha subunit